MCSMIKRSKLLSNHFVLLSVTFTLLYNCHLDFIFKLFDIFFSVHLQFQNNKWHRFANKGKVTNFKFEPTPVISLRLPAQWNVPVRENNLNLPKVKWPAVELELIPGRTFTSLDIWAPTVTHSHNFTPISILAYKPSTFENNTFFEISISRKASKFLEFFQNQIVYVVLLIKQHACKVSTPRLYRQEKHYWAVSIFHVKRNIPFFIF